MEEQKGGLLLVMAHPDDETFGAGGLVLRHTRAGIPTYLICATYGEAGWMGKPLDAKKENLPEIRAKEPEEASASPPPATGSTCGRRSRSTSSSSSTPTR